MQTYKIKYFEHSVKKETFWTKLIFETNKQEREFMIGFESTPKNFKGTYLSARCIITVQNTCIKDPHPSPFNPKLPLFKLKAPCYICDDLSSNFYQQFMLRISF